jgi:hypothetical protein
MRVKWQIRTNLEGFPYRFSGIFSIVLAPCLLYKQVATGKRPCILFWGTELAFPRINLKGYTIMTYPEDPIDPIDPIEPDEERVIISEGPEGVRETVVEERVVPRNSTAILLTRLIWLILGFVQSVIAIRIILRLIAADPANPFANFIYNLSALFVWPFVGLIADPAFNGAVLEVTSIIAMFVYLLLAWGLVELIWLVTRPAGQSYRVRERRSRRR